MKSMGTSVRSDDFVASYSAKGPTPIDHIAGDFTWNQMGGGCGKGGQSPLPVTEGAPHVRIEEILVGGDV